MAFAGKGELRIHATTSLNKRYSPHSQAVAHNGYFFGPWKNHGRRTRPFRRLVGILPYRVRGQQRIGANDVIPTGNRVVAFDTSPTSARNDVPQVGLALEDLHCRSPHDDRRAQATPLQMQNSTRQGCCN